MSEEPGAWVEIELEPSDRSERVRRREPHSETTSTGEARESVLPAPEHSEPASPLPARGVERPITAAIAVSVLLVGSVFGWFAARRGGERADVAMTRSDATPSTEAVEEPTAPVISSPPFREDGTLPPLNVIVDDVVTEDPSATTTEPALADPTIAVVPMPDFLVGWGIQLVGLTATGDLVEIDVDGGTMRTVDIGSNASSQSLQRRLIVGRDWTMVPPIEIYEYDARSPGDGVLVRRGGVAEPLASGLEPFYALAHGPGDTVWKWAELIGAGGTAATRYDVDGAPVGDEIAVPGYPVGADSAGGLISVATGGTYLTTSDRVTRLTTGELLAISDRFFLVRECDERYRCSVARVDRSELTRMEVPIEAPIEAPAEVPEPDPNLSVGGAVLYPFGPLESRSISPDGSHAIVVVQREQGALDLAVLAVLTGTLLPVPVGDLFVGRSIVWAPESNDALLIDDSSRVTAVDLDTGETVELEDWPSLAQLSVRPAD